ncbi:MAG: hypothetical protein Q9188_001979 [Gyalolechia gomerana]
MALYAKVNEALARTGPTTDFLLIIACLFEGQRRSELMLSPSHHVSSDHVSSDHPVYNNIHGHGSPILKDDLYAHISAVNPSMTQTASKADHARKCKNLAHIFSAMEVHSNGTTSHVDSTELCRDIKAKSEGNMLAQTGAYAVKDGIFDLRQWLKMFSYDAITAMLWSNTYGSQDRVNDMCPSQTLSGMTQVDAMDVFRSAAGFNALLAHLPAACYKVGRTVLKYSHD